MSDQTPDTAEDQGHEPSMEDILSSIRQMIDADDIGVDVPIHEESGREDSLEPTSLVKAVETDPTELAVEPVNPFDILESLAEADSADDLEIPEFSAPEPEQASVANTVETLDSDLLDVKIETALEDSPDLALSDNLADDEVLILDDILEIETEAEGASPSDYVEIDELSSDMDLVIEDEDETLLELGREDIVDATPQTPEVTPVTTANVTGDADMDLVKSLMADLTDDDMMDSADDYDGGADESHLDLVETETELPSSSAFLAIARKASAEAEAVERSRESEPLNITPDPAPEPVTPRQYAHARPDVQLDDTAIEEADDDLEIWVVEVEDEAEAEAESTIDDVVMNAVTETFVKDIIETDQQETPKMARAAADTILDDEIEADTSSAFASLAQVVQQQEEGAYMGPHIGELVTEAMKPMLKEWLDKNLKGIVERAVAKEVKRISGGK